MNQQSLLRGDLLKSLNIEIINGLNRNTLGEVFRGGHFRATADQKFEFFTYPQPNWKVAVKYTPVGISYQPRQKNLGQSIDTNEVTARVELGLIGENDRGTTLIKQTQAIEEYRNELLSGLVSVDVPDTAYQVYTDALETGEVPLVWEANTEYTILYNIDRFTDDLGYTVVDGIQINALSVTILPSDPTIGAIKFTTGANPTEIHKQFVTQGGISGDVKIRTALLLGDFISLDAETILSIVDGKDRTGLYESLIDNDKDFANWITSEFVVEYVVKNYTGSVSPDLLNPDMGMANINGDIRIIASMSISFDLSNGLISGTESTFKIKKIADANFTTLTTASIVIGNVKTTDTDQLLLSGLENSAKTRAQKRFRDIQVTVKNEDIPIFASLIDEFIGGAKVNEQYDIEFTLFNGGTKYEKLVILETGSASIVRGENQALQIQFKEFLE